MKRLCPASFEYELKMLRRLANHLVRGQGKYLGHEDLISAFTERSKRLVTNEPLAQYLLPAKTPDEKVEKLLLVEENIIGAENKRTLAGFISPILTHPSLDDQVCGPQAQPLARLKRLNELQCSVLQSGIQDPQKNQIAALLDVSAARIEARSKILAGIEARFANPVERAQALLKLCLSGIFTEGTLGAKARHAVLSCLRKPGFVNGYIAKARGEGQPDLDAKTAVDDLLAQLGKIGVSAEDGARILAA